MATDESVTPGEDAETWLPIRNWEGLYTVSNRGRVRSLDRMVPARGGSQRRVPGKILKPWTNTAGHPAVTLVKHPDRENWPVHMLVRETFDPRPEPVQGPEGPERWLPVKDFEEWYEVSDLGRVRSYHLPHGAKGRRKRPYLLTPTPKGTGKYLMVTLRQDDRIEWACVHVLVLTAFVSERPPGIIEARHGPAGRYDNSLSNLCWGSVQENHQDRVRDDAVIWGERSPHAKLTAAAVLDCRKRFAAGEKLTDLAREYGVSNPGLSQAVNGITWRYL